MTIFNQGWIGMSGEPITGKVPTRVIVHNTTSEPVTKQQDAEVFHAYKLFCDAVKVSAIPDGYHVQNRTLGDGSRIRLESINGVHKVQLWPALADDQDQFIMFASPRFIGISYQTRMFTDGDPGGSPAARPVYLFSEPRGNPMRCLARQFSSLPYQPGNMTWYDAREENANDGVLSWWTSYQAGGAVPEKDKLLTTYTTWYIQQGFAALLYLDGQVLANFGDIFTVAGAAIHKDGELDTLEYRVVLMAHPSGLFELVSFTDETAATPDDWVRRTIDSEDLPEVRDGVGAVKFNSSGTKFCYIGSVTEGFVTRPCVVEVDFESVAVTPSDFISSGSTTVDLRVSDASQRTSTMAYDSPATTVSGSASIGENWTGSWSMVSDVPRACDYVGDELAVLMFEGRFACAATIVSSGSTSASLYGGNNVGSLSSSQNTLRTTTLTSSFKATLTVGGTATTVHDSTTVECLTSLSDATTLEIGGGSMVSTYTTIEDIQQLDIRRYALFACDLRKRYVALRKVSYTKGQVAEDYALGNRDAQKITIMEYLGSTLIATTEKLVATPRAPTPMSGSGGDYLNGWTQTNSGSLTTPGGSVPVDPSNITGLLLFYGASTDQIGTTDSTTDLTGSSLNNGMVSPNVCSTPRRGRGAIVLSGGSIDVQEINAFTEAHTPVFVRAQTPNYFPTGFTGLTRSARRQGIAAHGMTVNHYHMVGSESVRAKIDLGSLMTRTFTNEGSDPVVFNRAWLCSPLILPKFKKPAKP